MEFEFKDIKYDYGKFKVNTNKLYTKLELDTFLNDRYTKDLTYSKTELNNLITTPNVSYVTVPTYASLPATGSANTIYRVSNYNGSTSQVDASVYSEYAWDGNDYVFLRISDSTSEVFDISVYKNNTTFTNLSEALGTNGVNVPVEARLPGMSIKFILSSDSNYVRYSLIANSFTTDPTKWQLDNNEPTINSLELMVYGKTKDYFINAQYCYVSYDDGIKHKYAGNFDLCEFINILGGVVYETNAKSFSNAGIAFYDSNKQYISGTLSSKFITPTNAKYASISNYRTTNPLDYISLMIVDNIDKRISDNQKDIVKLQDEFVKNIPFERNSFINYLTGEIADNSNYKATTYIKIKENTGYITNVQFDAPAGIAFYDESKNFISGVDTADFITPNEAVYVSICNKNSNVIDNITLLEARSIENRVNILEDKVNSITNPYSFHDLTPSRWASPVNGEINWNSAFECAFYISVKEKTKYSCNAKFTSGVGVAFYDENKTFISGSTSTTFTTPKNTKYCAISNDVTNDIPYLTLVDYSCLVLEVQDLKMNTPKIVTSNAFGAFRKFGVVGDSLSVGHNTDPITGITHPRDIENSWGRILSRKLGNICLNFGRSGASTKSWYTDELCYGEIIKPENLCQCYIVGIGTNDSGTIGDIDDIDWTDRDNNADTFYGNYAKILQLINSIATRAIIFCFTLPYPRAEAAKNAAIREIVANSNINNAFLVDLEADYNDYFKDEDFLKFAYDGHFNAVGYANCAEINLFALNNTIAYYGNKNVLKGIGNIPFGSNDIVN